MMTGMIAKTSIRNLVKHSRRSLLVGGTIALSAMVALINASIVTGVRRQLVEHLLVAQNGQLSISATLESAAQEREFASSGFVAQPDVIAGHVARLLPGARAVGSLSSLGMVLGETGGSARIAVWGIDTERDDPVLQHLRGRAVGAMDPLTSGTVYLSRKLSGRIGAELGDIVMVTVPSLAGELNAEDARVAGIVERGAPWQDYFVHIPLAGLQELLGAGSQVNSIKVFLPARSPNIERARAQLAAGLASSHPQLTVQTYEESGSFFLGIVTANRFLLGVMEAVLLLAAALGVGSAQLLSVNERRREVGTMIALGTPRSVVWGVFVCEGLLLSVSFGLIGAGAGAAIAALFSDSGIALPVEAFSWLTGAAQLIPALTWSSVPIVLVELAVAVTLASLYPAARAARQDPIQAITGSAISRRPSKRKNERRQHC